MESASLKIEDVPPADLVASLLEAIDGLLDAMEGLQAPITRELLGTAMMALVHECGLARPHSRDLN